MTELFFLRHGQRVNDALLEDPEAKPLLEEFRNYDPSLSTKALGQMEQAADEICRSTQAFTETTASTRKNIFVHFSPYLRCCQSADLLVSNLRERLSNQYGNYKLRFQLLGDFALSEWIHDEMKDKPPFTDSNDAYQLYTPNLKVLANKSACSNFRPLATLGPFNGPELSYKDYQSRCKNYFKKLLATYDKPAYIRNKDIVIIVTHGYVVNNFLSYFISRPIFNEIPEAKINLSQRVLEERDEGSEYQDECDPSRYTWKLTKDCLQILDSDSIDSVLSLETDVVYYKTNFIKKNDHKNLNSTSLGVPESDRPRPSFKVEQKVNGDGGKESSYPKHTNYLCSAAKDWTPQSDKFFKIKSEFKLKVMNDESFKKSFDLSHHPSRPISPQVSPNSEPTRNNSVIDLTKLADNGDIYKPMKLKYATTSNIPISQLNSKVNSQVHLAQFQRLDKTRSNDSNYAEFPKFASSLQSRKRSMSNPLHPRSAAHKEYFPLVTGAKSNDADAMSSLSSSDENQEHSMSDRQRRNSSFRNSPHPLSQSSGPEVNRSKSLGYKNYEKNRRNFSLKKNGKVQEQQDSDNDDSMPQRFFSLSFGNSKNDQESSFASKDSSSRKIGSHFIPSTSSSSHRNGSNKSTKPQPIFYQLHDKDDSYSSSDDSSDSNNNDDNGDKMDVDSPKGKDHYAWFGQNRK